MVKILDFKHIRFVKYSHLRAKKTVFFFFSLNSIATNRLVGRNYKLYWLKTSTIPIEKWFRFLLTFPTDSHNLPAWLPPSSKWSSINILSRKQSGYRILVLTDSRFKKQHFTLWRTSKNVFRKMYFLLISRTYFLEIISIF